MKILNTIIINKTEMPSNKKAFTLAETLITIVILGIVVVILVPNLIKKQVENTNRTKVKKSMAAYEKAIGYMAVENDLKSTELLESYGEDEDCKYTSEYFKKIQKGSSDCVFKTPDKVWWDISDITNPILILKEDQKNKSTAELHALARDLSDNTVYAMIGRFDDIGSLRVNDNGYEQSISDNTTNKQYMKKLWYAMNLSNSGFSEFDKCNLEGKAECTITKNGVSTTYKKYTADEDVIVYYHTYCESIAKAGEYWIADPITITADDAKDMEGSTCTHRNCTKNGDYWNAAKRICESQGAHLPKMAELIIAIDNGKMSENTSSYASETKNDHTVYEMSSNGRPTTTSKDSGAINGGTNQVICVSD